MSVVKTRIFNRIDTEANWNNVNPVLSSGEIAFVKSDNGTFMKVGNGSNYLDTPFFSNVKIDENIVPKLEVVHISQEDYHNLVTSDKIDDSTLYIVSSDVLNLYGEKIINVATPENDSDAATKKYVDELSVNLKNDIKIPIKTSELTNDSDFTTTAELNKVKTATNNLSNELKTKSAITIDGVKSDLSVVHITKDEYHELVISEKIDNSTLYIVSSDNLNAYGEKVTNILSGEDDADATNVAQVKSYINDLKTDIDENINILNEFVEKKICIDGQYSDLSILRVNSDEYHELVVNNQINNETLYIISSENINAYGERIENVATPISASDATNKEYVDNLSVELMEKIDGIEMPSKISELENDAKFTKVSIDGENTEDFIVKHVSQEEYHEIVNSNDGADSKTLYIVSSDALNLYGEQIKNLAPGVDLSDAVNVEQLNAAISSIDIPEIPSKVSEFENDAKYANISVDGEITTDFKVQHVSQEEYHNLVTSENGADSNTLYIVSSDTLNMYGERIVNVLSGIEETDAATVGQINKLSNDLISEINKIEIPANVSQLSNDTGFITAKVNGTQVSSLEVKNINQEEYHQLVVDNKVDSNTVYIVSSDTLNMYGEQIKNLAPGTDLSDAVNLEQLSTSIEQVRIYEDHRMHDFQVIRPDFGQNINIKLNIYSNQEMTDLALSVDSKTNPEYVAAFFNSGDEVYWMTPSASGVPAEYSNRPILIKLTNILKDFGLQSQFERLFISYKWYYETESGEHNSDAYSIVVPSYTEVGANASDYVSKQQFEELNQYVKKDTYQSQFTDDMYVCYATKTNVIQEELTGEVEIVLDSFSKSNQYDIKFKTGNQPVSFKFYFDDFNGVQLGDWKINSGYIFPEKSEYLIKIRQDMIEVIDGQNPLKEYGYRLIVGELSGLGNDLTCQIENRAITTLDIDQPNLSVTIKLPEKKYNNYARDFILRLNITELPCMIWDGIDDLWESTSDNDWMDLEIGQNIISFTEMG